MFYRRKSIRLSKFNYTNNGIYFVTFFTKNRIRCLSDVVKAEVHLTIHGSLLMETITRSFHNMAHVDISDIVIMPDHVHFIVAIKNSDQKSYTHLTRHNLLRSPASGSLGSIVRTIKSVSARKIRRVHPLFAWHRNYYERIIRDDVGLYNVKRYIALNPRRWEKEGDVT